MPTEVIRDNELFYLDKGTGFPLLLGHSYLFDHKMWQPQIEMLSKHYRVIAPDLWGHGLSAELPSQHESMADLAADYLELMDRLGIAEFAVIGLSVGGMWGAELAALAPDRVRALVLMDTYLGDETLDERAKYFNMLDTVDSAGAIAPPILEYICAQFHSESAPAELVGSLRMRLQNLSAKNLRKSIVPLGHLIFGRPNRLDILSKIKAEPLVVVGAEDKPRPVREAMQMANLLTVPHVVIPNAGHISSLDQPWLVNQTLKDFLSQNIK